LLRLFLFKINDKTQLSILLYVHITFQINITILKKASIIGSGIAGLSAAIDLAANNFEVTVHEKNDKPGGRINHFEMDGFKFDMGPSWYWMPEVFEDFYKKYGYTTSDFYELERLDPSYKVVFSSTKSVDIPADFTQLLDLFESKEKGSAQKLKKFIDEAAYKYKVGMEEFVWKPSHSIFEFLSLKILKSVFQLQLFSSISKEINNVVKDPDLRKILEFPVLFLGATPEDTPALYSLMNYADLKLGTWYPKGGMFNISQAFYKIAIEKGVKFKFNDPVREFEYSGNNIKCVVSDSGKTDTDIVVGAADYHHVDQHILSPEFRNYSASYWDSRKLAPSSLLMFLGVNKKIKNLTHHNLFFDTDFKKHASEIYKNPIWPTDPLFYVCAPSLTDTTVAPPDHENLFVLIPVAPDLDDNDEAIMDDYFNQVIRRIESYTGDTFKKNIVTKKFFGVKDFKSLYNSYKGNAYGLANTLFQTAFLKPSLKNKKLTNLYYSGQLTTPGPGLPPSIISGQVVAKEIIKNYK
jgi:phytoene desaturase